MFKALIENIFQEQKEISKSLELYAQKILEPSNDTKIVLMHRRWLIVFEILVNAFCDKHIKQLSHILCDSDCNSLNSSDYVLISDDIIIHGRTVTKLFKQLKQKGISSSITAFYRHVNANLADECNFVGFNGYCVTERDWHDLSNKLIQLILRSKIPYTTFTYSFAVTEGEICRKMDSCDIYQPLFKANDISLRVFFESQDSFPIFKSLDCLPCIRHYTYGNNPEEDNVSVFIPFVLIPSVNYSLFSLLAQNEAFPESVRKCFKSDLYTYEYKARLLSFVLSYAYGMVSLDIKAYDIARTAIIESIVSKSFLSSFDEVINLNSVACNRILQIKVTDSFKPDVNNKACNIQDDFCDFLNNRAPVPSEDVGDILVLESIRYLHEKNEERAKNQEDPMWGYKIADFQNVASSCSLDTYKILAYLYSVWDTGKGSYYFREYNGTVYGCVTDGEQAYRIDYQEYGIFSDAFFKLRDIAQRKEIKLLPLWNTFMERLIEKFANLLPKECNRIYSFLVNKTRSDFAGISNLFYDKHDFKETLDKEMNEFLQDLLQKKLSWI